jgi:hypothetical protein
VTRPTWWNFERKKTMQLQYDEDLIESAVLFSASGRNKNIEPLLLRRFHRERERLYSIADPDERNAAFFQLHLSWFREWSLEKQLIDVLNEFPLVKKSVRLIAFRKSRGKKDEGSEMYVNEAGRHAIISLRPERFESENNLTAFLRHEFMHLHDMVDPDFGYSPQTDLRVSSPGQQRLALERYTVLWDITIDQRLLRQNRGTIATREDRSREFDRTFQFWPQEKRAEVFQKLWNNPAPRHAELMELACDPCDLRNADSPAPGGLCPLCNFSTFQWATVESLSQPVIDRVRSEFPSWNLNQGICERCAEAYDVLACVSGPAC